MAPRTRREGALTEEVAVSDQTPGSAAPGWYPDPQNPGQQRYWDGTTWSAATPPPQGPSPAAAPSAPSPVGSPPPAPMPGAQPPTSNNAIVGLVLAIGSWFICPIIAAVAALFFARSSSKEIEASGGAIGGAGMNTATRIIAWINIGVYIVVGVVFAIIAALGIGIFAQVASTVDPVTNTQTGLADGEYVMESNASLVINNECTFSGPVYTMKEDLVKDTTVYGVGAECSLGTNTSLVYFSVTGGTARILDVR